MLPDKTEFDWEEATAQDIAEDTEADEWESWVSPLRQVGAASMWYIPEMSYEEWNRRQYMSIQSDDNSRFDEWWEEKMKRQRDGIE